MKWKLENSLVYIGVLLRAVFFVLILAELLTGYCPGYRRLF